MDLCPLCETPFEMGHRCPGVEDDPAPGVVQRHTTVGAPEDHAVPHDAASSGS